MHNRGFKHVTQNVRCEAREVRAISFGIETINVRRTLGTSLATAPKVGFGPFEQRLALECTRLESRARRPMGAPSFCCLYLRTRGSVKHEVPPLRPKSSRENKTSSVVSDPMKVCSLFIDVNDHE
jgi:hypothetical protein